MVMRVVDDLLNAIPMLRQYAFHLTGSRETGDDLIEQCLLEILENNVPLNGSSVTISLFKALRATHVFASNFECGNQSRRSAAELPHAKIPALPIQQRQALSLVHTLKFTYAETAEILNLRAHQVKRLVSSARILLPRPRWVRVDYSSAERRSVEPTVHSL